METPLQILAILVATNGAPIIVARVFRTRGRLPVDLGRKLADGRPVFGSSKTWRGLAAALATACAVSFLFGFSLRFGLTFGALVMTGDLLSSFVKRRRGLAPSDQSVGWDQLPESLFPSLYAVSVTGLAWWWAPVLSLAFMLIELLVSRPLFWLRIRKRPY